MAIGTALIAAPTTAPLPDAERYRFSGGLRFRAGDGMELLYLPESGRTALVAAGLAPLLEACTGFATLDAHAHAASLRLHGHDGERAALRQQLARLVEAGALTSYESWRGRCRRVNGREAPPAIATLGVPTRGRPALLERCLSSYIDNTRRFGRDTAFVVADDSTDARDQARNREIVEALQRSQGASIGYAGLDERRIFVARLAAAGVDRDAAELALLNPERLPVSTGAARNALLLQTLGTMAVSVDDDTLCRVAPSPDAEAGRAFTSQVTMRFTFFAEHDAALGATIEADEDFLGAHERLLGRSVEQMLGEMEASALDLATASPLSLRRLGRGPHVHTTALGVCGDSGMRSTAGYLGLRGRCRERLVASEALYRAAMSSRQVRRVVDRETIADVPFCMGLNLGLDNREGLPPFLPVLRNQDGVFGMLLKTAYKSAASGLLPWTIVHAPAAPRAWARDEIWAHLAQFRLAEMVGLLVGLFEGRPFAADGPAALRALGTFMQEMAGLAPDDRDELVRGARLRVLAAEVGELENRLREFGASPAFWAEDVRAALAALRAELRDVDVTPCDVRACTPGPEANARAWSLIARFGRLLVEWPAILEATRDLARQGVRIAR